MADTFTPHLNLVLPEIGASRSTWGTKLNANAQAIDAYLYARMPPGALQDFAGPTVPDGWLPCDGRAVGRVEYAALFAAIGGYWGAGDGSSTFNIPDLRGRVTLGAGSSVDNAGVSRGLTLAQRFGYWFVQLVAGNLPNINVVGVGDHVHAGWTDLQGDHQHAGYTDASGAHSHTVTTGQTTNNGYAISGVNNGSVQQTQTTSVAGAHAHNITTDVRGAHGHNIGIGGAGNHTHALGGADVAHENIQPSVGVTKMIFTGKVSVSATVLNSPAPGSAMARTLALGHAG